METTTITLLDTRTVRLVELVQLMSDLPFDVAARAVLDTKDHPDPQLDPTDPLAVVAGALVRVRAFEPDQRTPRVVARPNRPSEGARRARRQADPAAPLAA